MLDINSVRIPRLRYSGGSSTLILGNKDDASQLFSAIASNIYQTERIYGHYPEVIRYICPPSDQSEPIPAKWLKNLGHFLESPREMIYQTYGKMIVFGGKLLFVLGVTDQLVDKFDSQNLGFVENDEEVKTDTEDNECECYEDEYPALDEFGNPNDISWLREYALRAEEFSQSQQVDLFLNLEWNKSKDELPSPFWLLFDRIYEIKNGNDGKIIINQIR